MIDAGKFIGMGEINTKKLATDTTVPTMLTNCMQMNRLTLVVQGGMVTSAKIG